jgi:hypothetical protein
MSMPAALEWVWDKRQRGYQAMGYRVPASPVSDNLDFDAVVDAAITKARTK